ncbi:restriction endonuclease subunit S [Psychrobacter celer]|uniref:restriction endonuclease subunit S n=1 Tax=Psychrobacter celer TaxID=306572 RepID=UPI003FCFB128
MQKIKDIFEVFNGSSLDFGKQQCSSDGINFVSRNSNNNGVVDRVVLEDDVRTYKKGDISVPLGGSYLLSAFVQEEDFVTAQNVAVLRPKQQMSDIEKWFYCYILRVNRFKFSAFGREVNKYIRDIEIPKDIPEWVYNIELNSISTRNTLKSTTLEVDNWEYFNLDKLFKINAGKYYYSSEYDAGQTPYVSATNKNNGIGKSINLEPDFRSGCITTEKIACTAFYQNENFCATSDVNILSPEFKISESVALFITTVINFNENFRWNYGRQCRVNNTKKIKIKLPVALDDNGKYLYDDSYKFSENGYIPDFNYMENYIKQLPFGEHLK